MTVHVIPLGFHAKHIYAPIKKYGADKIIYISSNPKDELSKRKVDEALFQAVKITKEVLAIPFEIVKIHDDYNFAKQMDIFNSIFESNEDLVVNITGGPKFDAFILYLVALRYTKKVKEIIYIREDIGEIITFPKFVYSGSLTDFELELIKTLKNEEMDVNLLTKKLNKKSSQVLRYIKSLEEKGLILSSKKGKKRSVKISFAMVV